MKAFLMVLLISSLPCNGIAAACDLTVYKGSEFHPNSARVHTQFLSNVEDINGYAKECDVQVYITSSYRSSTRVNGAIVTPAVRSNHLIGHAIDMNLYDRVTKKFCNSKCLVRSDRPCGVTCFINKIRSDPVLRWGGDFSTPDPVHIDDKTNLRNPTLWSELYQSLQNNC